MAGATPIVDPTPNVVPTLLQSLIGNQTSGTTDTATQNLINALTTGTQQGSQVGTQQGTTGTTTGTTSGSSTVNTAQLGPLLQAFAQTQANQGMNPETLQALISSIFQEGARAVPELTQQFANSTGSRVQGNSGLNLALGDLNRQLSSQALQAVLGHQQQSQATAGNIAAQIAANTRETQQASTQQQAQQGVSNQATTANTTQANTENRAQTQTGTTNSTNTAATAANPNRAALLGLGGVGLNFLDKRGAFDSILGRTGAAAPAAGGGVGTISGSGNIVPNSVGGSTLANPGGTSAGFLNNAPAASQGTLAVPAAPAPAPMFSGATSGIGQPIAAPATSPAFTLGGGGGQATTADYLGGGGGFMPSGGGVTGLGGFGSTSGGLLGTAANVGFGALPSTADYFGTAGTDSLGSNLAFGSNPYSYGGDAGGITGFFGGSAPGGNLLSSAGAPQEDLLSGFGNFMSSFGGGISDFASGVGDFFGSFFADGGQVGAKDRGIGAVGDTRYGGRPAAPAMPATNLAGNIWQNAQRQRELAAGLSGPAQVLQQGTNVQVPATGGAMDLLPQFLKYITGYADGGQIGGTDVGVNPTRIRNANYMGLRPRDQQSEALNYEGYGSGTGSTSPAGSVPATVAPAGMMSMMSAGPQMATVPTQQAGYIDPAAREAEMAAARDAAYRAEYARQSEAYTAAEFQRMLAANQRSVTGGGSGGIGEGQAPVGNEVDNGAAGIGPSGIAAAPTGTTSAIGAAANALGLGVPGISSMLSMIAAMAAAVNAANSPGAPSPAGGIGGVGGALGSLGAVSSPVSQSSVVGVPLGLLGDISSGESVGGLSGAPDEGSQGNASGETGVSAGNTGDAGGSGGDAGEYADGGLVRGPGTGTSDSIRVKSRQPGGKDIYYSDEEYVIPRDVVRALGRQHFDSMLDAFHTPASMQ